MKTLILNGSPRKKGDTVALIQELIHHLEGEVKVVSAYYDNIKPCIDCRYCWHEVGCSIKDDMFDIYDYVLECDNIIIASPLYFSELTGQLLSLISRLQTYWSSKFIRKTLPITKEKMGGIILTGGNGNKDKAYDTSMIILKLLNTTLAGAVFSLNTDSVPSKDDENAIKDIKILAEKLNRKI